LVFLNSNPPNLHLPSSWDYRNEPLTLTYKLENNLSYIVSPVSKTKFPLLGRWRQEDHWSTPVLATISGILSQKQTGNPATWETEVGGLSSKAS
jgi:hypothetical protein